VQQCSPVIHYNKSNAVYDIKLNKTVLILIVHVSANPSLPHRTGRKMSRQILMLIYHILLPYVSLYFNKWGRTWSKRKSATECTPVSSSCYRDVKVDVSRADVWHEWNMR